MKITVYIILVIEWHKNESFEVYWTKYVISHENDGPQSTFTESDTNVCKIRHNFTLFDSMFLCACQRRKITCFFGSVDENTQKLNQYKRQNLLLERTTILLQFVTSGLIFAMHLKKTWPCWNSLKVNPYFSTKNALCIIWEIALVILFMSYIFLKHDLKLVYEFLLWILIRKSSSPDS